jgi:hypothetical protein
MTGPSWLSSRPIWRGSTIKTIEAVELDPYEPHPLGDIGPVEGVEEGIRFAAKSGS